MLGSEGVSAQSTTEGRPPVPRVFKCLNHHPRAPWGQLGVMLGWFVEDQHLLLVAPLVETGLLGPQAHPTAHCKESLQICMCELTALRPWGSFL